VAKNLAKHPHVRFAGDGSLNASEPLGCPVVRGRTSLRDAGRNCGRTLHLICFTLLLLTFGRITKAQQPANVVATGPLTRKGRTAGTAGKSCNRATLSQVSWEGPGG
jgi:hypothetical protein